MIHICFCIQDSTGLYSKFVGTTMLSIFENTNTLPPSITAHIFHDNTLSVDNREKLSYVANQYGQIVKFYNVEETCADKIETINKLLPRAVKLRFTIGMYYRFFIPHILPPEIDKIIYLDGDLIVNLDINELWQYDLGDKVLGGIPTHFQKINPPPGDNKYEFNSGVLIMNMPAFRAEEENLNNSIKIISEDSKYVGNDQEILNHCFDRKILHLPIKFNRPVKWERRQKITQIQQRIYHFNGAESLRSFGLDMNDPFNRLWITYFIKTPWFNADSIGRLYATFQQMRNGMKNHILRVSAAMSGRERVFFVESKKLVAMKKFFSIRDDEEIILADNEKSLAKLIRDMQAAKGKKIFFIVNRTFMGKSFPFSELAKVGLAYGKDFLKGWELLSETQGEPFDSRPLIKAL